MARAKKKKPTAKEWVFIKEFVETHDASAAYRKAFPDNNPDHAKQYGYKLKNKEHIKEAIQRTYEEAIGPNEQIVIENIRFWKKMRDNDDAKDADRISAARDLAKFGGLFTEKHEHSGEVSVNIIDDI